MSKTLPIQQVHFRGERDQFLTEGGGGSRLPAFKSALVSILTSSLPMSVVPKTLRFLFTSTMELKS